MNRLNIRTSIVNSHFEIETSRNKSAKFELYCRLGEMATLSDVHRTIGTIALNFCTNNANGLVKVINLI